MLHATSLAIVLLSLALRAMAILLASPQADRDARKEPFQVRYSRSGAESTASGQRDGKTIP